MANITIAGDAVVVKSAMKLEDLATIQKYRPDALKLRGGEDGKKVIFSVCVTPGVKGCINEIGAEFGAETHDDEKKAAITMCVPPHAGDDIKEIVADEIGAAVMSLNKLEETLPTVLEEIAAEKQNILANISVA